jgi:hypothetical protein
MSTRKALGIGLVALAIIIVAVVFWRSKPGFMPQNKRVQEIKEQLPSAFISTEAKSEDLSSAEAAAKVTPRAGETLQQGIRYTLEKPLEEAYAFAANQAFNNGWLPVAGNRNNDEKTVIRMYNKEKMEYLYIVLLKKTENSTEINVLPVTYEDPTIKLREGNK